MSKERSVEQVCQTNVRLPDRTRTQTVAGGGMEWCGVEVGSDVEWWWDTL